MLCYHVSCGLGCMAWHGMRVACMGSYLVVQNLLCLDLTWKISFCSPISFELMQNSCTKRNRIRSCEFYSNNLCYSVLQALKIQYIYGNISHVRTLEMLHKKGGCLTSYIATRTAYFSSWMYVLIYQVNCKLFHLYNIPCMPLHACMHIRYVHVSNVHTGIYL